MDIMKVIYTFFSIICLHEFKNVIPLDYNEIKHFMRKKINMR